jgi:hypothetical protein
MSSIHDAWSVGFKSQTEQGAAPAAVGFRQITNAW